MRRIVLTVLGFLLFVPGIHAQEFKTDCEFPLQLKDLKKKQGIDGDCGIKGSGSDASKAQNAMKNNFCGVGATNPVVVTVNDLRALQGKTEAALKAKKIPFGSPTAIPADRGELAKLVTLPNGKKLAEGRVVTLVAFLRDAHYSNVKSGEKVNCSKTGKKNNDIHVELIPTRGSDPCNGVSAEISPHFRPEAWEEFVDYWITNPVKITGQLFFDASHSPCRNVGKPNEKRPRPARISSWEIHPVYAIWVCKNSSIAGCPANDASKWIPFHKWLELPDDEAIDEPRLAKTNH